MTRTFPLTIPPVFARDLIERDFTVGVGRWTRRGYATILSADELLDLKADASHHTQNGLDAAPLPVAISAKATLRAIAKVELF